jgi:hypothetical protein
MTASLKRCLKNFKQQVARRHEMIYLPGLRRIRLVYLPLTAEKVLALGEALEAWHATTQTEENPEHQHWLQRLEQVNAVINLAVVFSFSTGPFAQWQNGDFILSLLSLPTREAIAVRIQKKVLAFWLLPTTSAQL